MPIPLHRVAATLVVTACSLSAQTGNEVIFVGTSVGGGTDPHYFVASATGAATGAGSTFTDNVTDAAWNDSGRNLYVAQSIRPQVSLAQWNGTAPSWSVFYNAPGACYGLGLDRWRQRLWVLTGSGASSRELVCLDADPVSANYGSVLAQTNTLTGASRERWGLSQSGNYAVVPHVFLQGGLFQIVDTDLASPNFGQIVVSTQVPNAALASFAFSSSCEMTIDDQYAMLLYTGIGPSAIAVLHVPTQTWLDFDATAPGQQDFVLPSPVANRMALALTGQYLVVSGQGGGGWCGRVDFDYATPSNSTFTPFTSPNGLPNCNGASLSFDGLRCAVTTTPTNLQTPSYLEVFEVLTGTHLRTVTLPTAWNVYTTAWQDASPIADFTGYGTGCPGALGTPSLDAVGASRPAIGSTLQLAIGNVPQGVAILGLGFSNTTTGTFALPLDLTPFGLANCTLFAAPQSTTLLLAAGTTATWNWSIGNQPAWFGARFYCQAFVLDTGANAVGLTLSNAGAGRIGY